ncbi:hypothetical protein LXL04_001895 [Taraxacum kok-saghyz]
MRFKKGSKVEVMNKKPPPSWHVAEIVSGNGDSYDGYQNKVFRRFIKPSLPTKHSLKSFQKEQQQQQEDDYRSHKSHVIVSRNQNRVKHCSSQSPSQRYIIQNDSYKKVDAFVGNTSLNGCYYEMEKRKRNDDDDDSDECSVGSCSVVDIVSNHDDDDGDDGGDDVAVSNGDIHRLELDAYRATLEALYASGPLSWEKEALLTNLRINLHISNDEHLIEVTKTGGMLLLLPKIETRLWDICQHPFATDKNKIVFFILSCLTFSKSTCTRWIGIQCYYICGL